MQKSNLLFHYTSSEALPFILNLQDSTSLRATGIRYLNDQSELHFGIEKVLQILKSKGSELNIKPTALNTLIENFEESTLDKMSFNHYVACFSRATELVDQWRGYGENGLGFALGYSPHEITNIFKINPNIMFAACLYNFEAQESTLIRLVNKSIDLMMAAYKADIFAKDDLHDISIAYAEDALQKQLLRIKHGAYRQEEEWRIIVNLSEPIGLGSIGYLKTKLEFRSSRRGLVPFTTLKLPLPKILIVGPSEHQSENHAAAALLLESRGISLKDDISLEVEKIPYRG